MLCHCIFAVWAGPRTIPSPPSPTLCQAPIFYRSIKPLFVFKKRQRATFYIRLTKGTLWNMAATFSNNPFSWKFLAALMSWITVLLAAYFFSLTFFLLDNSYFGHILTQWKPKHLLSVAYLSFMTNDFDNALSCQPYFALSACFATV